MLNKQKRVYEQVGSSDSAYEANNRIVRKTAPEVERNPNILPVIERECTGLARAIERLSPKLNAIAERGLDSETELVAACTAQMKLDICGFKIESHIENNKKASRSGG